MAALQGIGVTGYETQFGEEVASIVGHVPKHPPRSFTREKGGKCGSRILKQSLGTTRRNSTRAHFMIIPSS